MFGLGRSERAALVTRAEAAEQRSALDQARVVVLGAELARFHEERVEDRARYEALVGQMVALKRSGFEPAPTQTTMRPAVDDLPAVIRTAIADRGGDPYLEQWASKRLADNGDPAEIATEIYDGDDR